MRTDASARDDLLFLAILSTSVIDALMSIREGSTLDATALEQAKTIVKAVAEKRYHALPEAAFPTTPRQLQTILDVWNGDQVAEVLHLIEAVAAGSTSAAMDVEANGKLMKLFGRLGRRALRQMGEPALEQVFAV